MEPDEIDALARRAKAGDRDALEALLAAVRWRTMAICRGVLHNAADAEDACQETLVRVATKIGGWNEQGRFTTWLRVVATNSALTARRRMRTHAVASDVIPLDKPDLAATDLIARLDLLDALRALQRRHPQYVEPLLMRAVHGLGYREIAEQVGAPVGTVKSRVHQARKYLEPRLRESA